MNKEHCPSILRINKVSLAGIYLNTGRQKGGDVLCVNGMGKGSINIQKNATTH